MSELRIPNAFRSASAFSSLKTARIASLGCALGAIALLGCRPAAGDRWQGYIEGEFVYVASPRAGALEKLSVAKGTEVKSGDALYTLAAMPESAARDEAREKLKRAQ